MFCTLNNKNYYSSLQETWERQNTSKSDTLHCLEGPVISHLAMPTSTSQNDLKI